MTIIRPWANDQRFHELTNERDPIIGTQDGSYDLTIPKRPIRKIFRGRLPSRPSGAAPISAGIRALRFLAGSQAKHVS